MQALRHYVSSDASAAVDAGSGAQTAQKAVHVIGISRANNIAIMLTQFSAWDDEDIRAAVLDDSRLSTDKLSLLLQAGSWNAIWRQALQSAPAQCDTMPAWLSGSAVSAV